jgi:hypothetical protein
VEKFIKDKNFTPEHMKKISYAGGALCKWCRDWYEAASSANQIPKEQLQLENLVA